MRFVYARGEGTSPSRVSLSPAGSFLRPLLPSACVQANLDPL